MGLEVEPLVGALVWSVDVGAAVVAAVPVELPGYLRLEGLVAQRPG